MNTNGADPRLTDPVLAAQIDRALATLASATPRAGLEQRILAHLEAAPQVSWPQRWLAMPLVRHRWAAAAASAVIVAGGVGLTAYSHHPAPAQPLAFHLPRPAHQPVSAAASVMVDRHLEGEKKAPHHRGVRRGFRAMHEGGLHAPLPRGTAIPTHLSTVPVQ